MKKLFISLGGKFNPQAIILIVTCLIIGSCKKEQMNEQAKNEIIWAKDYYNTALNSIKPNPLASSHDQKPGANVGQYDQGKGTPLWQLSSAGESEEYTFV